MEHEAEDMADLPERSCVVTRTPGEPADLIRFALAPDGVVTPDLAQRLPGRGVWVTARQSMVREAVKKGLFSKGFKAKAEASADLPERVGRLLKLRALDYLALAKKAGLVVAGHDKVEEAVNRGVAVLIEAADGAEGGRRKMRARAARQAGTEPVVTALFTSDELGLALGRPHVIHAAVSEGPLAGKFLEAVRRLEAYEDGPGSSPGQ